MIEYVECGSSDGTGGILLFAGSVIDFLGSRDNGGIIHYSYNDRNVKTDYVMMW